MIDLQTVQAIKGAMNVVDVISDFVTLKKAGANYKCCCPFHNERTPSFMVSPVRNTYHCFSCNAGGNAITFLMEHESMTYPEALRWLANKYNIPIVEKEMTQEDRAAQNLRQSLFIVNDWANRFFQQQLTETSEGQSVGLAYFRSRGFRDDIIQKFQLGYCPENGRAMSDAALANGYNGQHLLDMGLSVGTLERLRDKYRGRVIFPVHKLDGKIVAFGGRVLGKADNVAKYINSSDSPIYVKRNELYGLYLAKKAIQKQNRCYMVEGYTDVISMHQCGIENVVASSGTSLTYEQIRLVKRFTKNMTVLYDGDAAGIKASLRGIDMLLEEDMQIKVLLLPDGDDPDSFARKHTAEEYVDYINANQEDFIHFKLRVLKQEGHSDPIARAELISSIAHSIALIPNVVLRSVYIRDCYGLLNIDEEALSRAVDAERRAYYDAKRREREQEQQRQENAAHRALDPDNTAPIAHDERDWMARPPQRPQVARKPFTPKTPLETCEQNLISLILNRGEKVMLDPETQQDITALQLISREMDADELGFSVPMFQMVYDECKRQMNDSGFVPSVYFQNHENQDFVTLAAALLTQKYDLTKRYSQDARINPDDATSLANDVPRTLLELKLALVKDEIASLGAKLQKERLSEEEEAELYQYQAGLRQVRVAIEEQLKNNFK